MIEYKNLGIPSCTYRKNMGRIFYYIATTI